MNDFLTEKNKKTGVLGKLKWVLCGFCILFTLGAIGAAEKYIGEGRWGMAATEIILGLLFLYPTFREIQKALKKKKAREIACWFESSVSIYQNPSVSQLPAKATHRLTDRNNKPHYLLPHNIFLL